MWLLIPIAFVTAWILIPSKKEGKGTENGNVETDCTDGGSGNCHSDSRGESGTTEKAGQLAPPKPETKEAPKPELKVEQVTAAETKPAKEEIKNAADIGTPTTQP